MCVTANLCVQTFLTVLTEKKKIITVWVYFLQPQSLFLSTLTTSTELLQALWKGDEADAEQCACPAAVPLAKAEISPPNKVLTNMHLHFTFIIPSEFILTTLLHFKISALTLKCRRKKKSIYVLLLIHIWMASQAAWHALCTTWKQCLLLMKKSNICAWQHDELI